MPVGPHDEHDHASAAVVAAARRGRRRTGRLTQMRCGRRASGGVNARDYRICYSSSVGDWDIYVTSEVAAWLENLQASDTKTADLVDDDAIYALSRSGPALGRPLVDTI